MLENDQQPNSEKAQKEHNIFMLLVQAVPGLDVLLSKEPSQGDILHVADLIQKGVNSARADDTKSLKGAILDWITPLGGHLNPPLSRNSKIDRGFHHNTTGALLCPTGMDWENVERNLGSGEIIVTGDHWPMFLYSESHYDEDNPWKGLLRNSLLVKAFKHIFTSPSSVDKEPKATRSGNARIHGMLSVTQGSIAYVATQVRFALSSSPVFSRTDTSTDSECFYNSIMELLTSTDDLENVNSLIAWWNSQVFPGASSASRQPLPENSAWARIQKKHTALRSIQPGQG